MCVFFGWFLFACHSCNTNTHIHVQAQHTQKKGKINVEGLRSFWNDIEEGSKQLSLGSKANIFHGKYGIQILEKMAKNCKIALLHNMHDIDRQTMNKNENDIFLDIINDYNNDLKSQNNKNKQNINNNNNNYQSQSQFETIALNTNEPMLLMLGRNKEINMFEQLLIESIKHCVKITININENNKNKHNSDNHNNNDSNMNDQIMLEKWNQNLNTWIQNNLNNETNQIFNKHLFFDSNIILENKNEITIYLFRHSNHSMDEESVDDIKKTLIDVIF